ncbi:MAG: hypothetical protein IJP48_10690 [Synergistaceae bacterium]|nr:hypothetical protein [Synergistaceae bacterium]
MSNLLKSTTIFSATDTGAVMQVQSISPSVNSIQILGMAEDEAGLARIKDKLMQKGVPVGVHWKF